MSVGALVVDSGAFIKGAPVEKWGGRVFTVQEVVDEIRDVSTRRRLRVLPYELVFREPTQAALHHVTAFAKKTGDYPNLSHVDLKLIALTYQLECELGTERGANLRGEPQRTQPDIGRKSTPNTVGFYSGSNDCAQNTTHSKSITAETSPTTVREDIENESCEDRVVDLEPRLARVELTEDCSNAERDCHQFRDEENSENDTECKNDHEVVRNGDRVGVEWNGDRTVGDEGDTLGDDDSAGWITPKNFEQACEEMGGVLEERANEIAVGCATTDFAMQNVMLQIGLNVISLDGMRIRQFRTYALRCKACFRTTSNTSELFCPHCGNKTMIKVSVLVDESGTTHYRHLSDKQFSHRGLRYSLPLPKGGRHAHNPILAPDQRITHKERRTRTNKVNPMDPDYIALESPFAMKDVTSRGAKIASMNRARGQVARRGRNPNAVQSKGRRK